MTAIPSPAATSERRADPSMEEILASIRKIIADEDGPVPRAPLRSMFAPDRAPAEPHASHEHDQARSATGSVLPISQGLAASRPPGQPPFGLSRPAAVPTPSPSFREPPRILEPLQRSTPSQSSAVSTPSFTATAVPIVAQTPAASIGEPAKGASGAHAEPAPAETASRAEPADAGSLISVQATDSIASAFQALSATVAMTSAETIDRHIRDLLRPMLRGWLDDNLPIIVEKLVRVEIERVARGGR